MCLVIGIPSAAGGGRVEWADGAQARQQAGALTAAASCSSRRSEPAAQTDAWAYRRVTRKRIIMWVREPMGTRALTWRTEPLSERICSVEAMVTQVPAGVRDSIV